MLATPPTCRHWLCLGYTSWLALLVLRSFSFPVAFFFLHVTPLHHSRIKCQMPLTGALMARDAAHRKQEAVGPQGSGRGRQASWLLLPSSPLIPCFHGLAPPPLSHDHTAASPAQSHLHAQLHCTHSSDREQMPLCC